MPENAKPKTTPAGLGRMTVDEDDGVITVRWWRGDELISLSCIDDGRLVRVISPVRLDAPPVTVHVMDFANGR